ncbi:unnamed protein product [Trichogramma brassicae]|uniref:Major facilitator superfamily (MFS) profile domain-containing protein n=1 Tax=Trichogramma brassicae TaxID=86971 RepID=A0A6H5I944_9HYME|nr:unnamed protein product [Trichogramma brassicae]
MIVEQFARRFGRIDSPERGKNYLCRALSLGRSPCLLSIGVGTGLAWSAPMEKYLESEESHIARMTEEEFSWTSSLLAIGAMVGALPTGALANALGRKRVLLMLTLPFLLSWGLILVANAAWMLNAARVIVGVAIGSACVLVPTYLSEIAEDEVRGTLGALFQFFLTVGIVYGFCLGAYLDYYGLAVGCAVVEILFVSTFVMMPESPAWLVSKGQKSEAMKALQRLRGDRYDVRAELSQLQKEAEEKGNRRSSVFDLVRLEVPRKALVICLFGMIFQQLSGINAVIFYAEGIFKAAGSKIDPKLSMILVSSVQASVNQAFNSTVKITDLFTVKANFKALLFTCAGVSFQQFTGINVVLFYTQNIFEETGTNIDPAICAIITGVVQLGASCVTPVVVDRLGRRPLLIVSGAGTALATGALGVFFFMKDELHSDVSQLSWLPIASIILFMCTYCIGWGPLPWGIMGELFSADVKAKASSITVLVCWAEAFVITKYFSNIAQSAGFYTGFWIFTAFCVLSVLFTLFLLPETKGKSLQQIQDELNGVKSSAKKRDSRQSSTNERF